MTVKTSFKHMVPSDAIKAYTQEKCEKLKKYFNGKISVSWNFGADKLLRSAHCHLVGNSMDFFGHAETEDLRASIDLVVEKIERQLRKRKEIVRDHLHRNGHRLPQAG